MRELDRHAADHTKARASARDAPGGSATPGTNRRRHTIERIAIVGAGRAGTALAAALADAGLSVLGPFGREKLSAARAANGAGPLDAVLLCVPDSEIAGAARAVAGAAPFVGHTSGATPLSALGPADRAGAELFALHPLQTLTGEGDAGRLAGAGCAVAGSTPRALAAARELAHVLQLESFEIADEQRPAYHAAASAASNFLVTLQHAAETIARQAGMAPADSRQALLPLVRTTVENWARLGPEGALTGPVARGDEGTVAAHRAAVERSDPTLLPLFDALVERTRTLAARSAGGREPTEPAAPPGMVTARTVADARRAVGERRAGRPETHRVGLVPTMGALHEGHLSLLRRAREECDTVVMSLFVNPTQFRAGEDLAAYPRDEGRDTELAEAHGVDLLFAPSADEVYPAGFDTQVAVGRLTEVLCGEPSRRGPEHFRGVTTVVTKLLNIFRSDVAYFGQKDAQQAIVIRKLVRDLDIPVEIAVLPTVRDPDGLALSSRNAYLDEAERRRALGLSRALRAAETAVAQGERDAGALLRAAHAELDAAGIDPEYLELRSADDLVPVIRAEGPTLLAVAARIGGARLIDNTILESR